MLDTGGYVALVLVAIELLLIHFFVNGGTSKGIFIAASIPIVFLAVFFWMGGRVTETTITGIGTIKSAVNMATQYVEDIRHIKAEVEQQKEAVGAIAKTANATDSIVKELTQKNDQATSQLTQVTEQLAQAKKLADELQNKQDYWEVAKLTAIGLSGLVGPENTLLTEHSAINNLLGPYVKLEPFAIDCHLKAVAAYEAVIKLNDRFPFAYYYRGICNRGNKIGGWQKDFETAKSIFLITTSIPGHHANHDEFLKLIETDNLQGQAPPGFTANEDGPR